MIKRKPRKSPTRTAAKDIRARQELKQLRRTRFPDIPKMQADRLCVSDAVLAIEPGDLQEMWMRPDCEQAARLLREIAPSAPIERMFAAAVDLLWQLPSNAQRAGALRNMLSILRESEENEGRCRFST